MIIMKKITALQIGFLLITSLSAQNKVTWSFLFETERIVKTLSSDDWTGRRPFTEGNDKAAAFIADEFKTAGLQPWDGKSFLQSFTIDLIHLVSANGTINGEQLDEKNVFVLTTGDLLKANDK